MPGKKRARPLTPVSSSSSSSSDASGSQEYPPSKTLLRKRPVTTAPKHIPPFTSLITPSGSDHVVWDVFQKVKDPALQGWAFCTVCNKWMAHCNGTVENLRRHAKKKGPHADALAFKKQKREELAPPPLFLPPRQYRNK